MHQCSVVSKKAAEKALKAAQYSKDADKTNQHNLYTNASGLGSDELTALASSLEGLLGDSARMRYPDRTGFVEIPNDVYTRDMAVEAQSYAQRILAGVERYINSRGAWSVGVFLFCRNTPRLIFTPSNTFVFARPTITGQDYCSTDTEQTVHNCDSSTVSNPHFRCTSLSLTLFNVASLKGQLRVVGGRGRGEAEREMRVAYPLQPGCVSFLTKAQNGRTEQFPN